MTQRAYWTDATEWMLPQLTARLLIMLYIGLQLDYATCNRMCTTVHGLDVVAVNRVADTPGSKETAPSDVARPRIMIAAKLRSFAFGTCSPHAITPCM